jgi:hypothetical protein
MTDARRPTVAVLAPHWGRTDEGGWITRQVTGALAYVADVHVVTPAGPTAGSAVDGVVTVHSLATPLDPVAELRRDLLLDAFEATSTADAVVAGPDVAELLDAGLVAPWAGAAAVLDRLAPDLAVVVGHRSIGALHTLRAAAVGLPYVLLTLAPADEDAGCVHFDPLVDGAVAVLTVTESERDAIVARHGRAAAVHRIGAPLAVNPSARTEPNPWVGDSGYVLVLTGATRADEKAGGFEEEHELSRLIRFRFPDRPVGVSHPDAFCVWQRGQVSEGWPIERSSDLARLLAFARVTVDFRPGELFARRDVESLLYGAPIIVPHDRRAVEHARLGGAGLWFEGPGDLVTGVEALLDPTIHDTFAERGRAYAADRYGSTDRFVRRVLAACGMEPAGADAPVPATSA